MTCNGYQKIKIQRKN